MAKKEFEWNSTQSVGEVEINERKKVEVSFNSLEFEDAEGTEEKWFVSLATAQHFKKKGEEEASWHYTKNATFPFDKWFEITRMIDDHVE